MASRRLYFINAPVDFLLIGGVSVAAYVVLGTADLLGTSISTASLAAWAVWVCNWPHFSATNYRLYRKRDNIAQYPATALLIPLLIGAAAAASFVRPDTVAPHFIKFFVIWLRYHFAAQSLGIALLYAHRAGFRITPAARYALIGFLFGTFLFAAAGDEVGTTARVFSGVVYPVLGLPLWVESAAEIGMYTCGIAFALIVGRNCLRQRRCVPPIVLLPIIVQWLWFAPGNELVGFSELVPLFHSLQYLLIAWAMQLSERLDETGSMPSPRFAMRESLRWGTFNILGGILLFWVVPRIGAAFEVRAGIAEAVFVAAIQVHHFFVDGVIWKLRRQTVGQPLAMTLRDVTLPQAEVAT